MINNIVEVHEIISMYEDEGFFESEVVVMLVCDNAFHFRNKLTSERETIIYLENGSIKERREFKKEEISKMRKCLTLAQKYGFYVK